MFSKIRARATYANVAMTLALVFAMSGGAYAAKRYVITSTKQISPKVLKALAGKVGAEGKEGKAGTPGTAGKDGVNGVNGKDGAAGASGESVGVKAVPTKVSTCAEQGGSEFKVGATSTLACNGQTGFTETLPSGKSERGQWGGAAGAGAVIAAISFTIPLSEGPKARFMGLLEGEDELHEATAVKNHECRGTAAAPVAAPGYLCIFTSLAENVGGAYLGSAELKEFNANELAGKSGAVMELAPAGGGALAGAGPWVVTAE
jgi:hypothetical protein